MKRRDFIRTAGAGVFSIASSGTVFGAVPSGRASIAIIGCARSTYDPRTGACVLDPKGNRGRGFQVMSRFMDLPNCEISVVCDVDTRAMDLAAAAVKAATGREPRKVRDFRNVLADPSVDGVVVATPDHSHVYIGCAAMKAGKALYLEKPIGVTAGEAEVLAEVQKSTGATFLLGTQRRSSYPTQQGVAAIRSGKYGEPHWAKAWCMSDRPAMHGVKPAPVPGWLDWDLWQCCAPRAQYRSNIVHYNWRFIRGYGTGDLPNNGLHFVDIARWALGAEWPERIYAGGGHLFCEGENWDFDDTHMLTVQFPGKKFLTWEGCSHASAFRFMDKWTGCLVYCDDATVFFGPRGEAAVYDRSGRKLIREWDANETDPSSLEGERRLSDPTRGCDNAHVAGFVKCVLAKSRDTTQPVDSAVKSNLLTEMGNVSLLVGEAIHINPATGKLARPTPEVERLWSRSYEPGWEVKA